MSVPETPKIGICRRLALPVLPNGDPTLIVRVLEAFMALQFQAGVLTEELVLAVQGLVEVSALCLVLPTCVAGFLFHRCTSATHRSPWFSSVPILTLFCRDGCAK